MPVFSSHTDRPGGDRVCAGVEACALDLPAFGLRVVGPPPQIRLLEAVFPPPPAWLRAPHAGEPTVLRLGQRSTHPGSWEVACDDGRRWPVTTARELAPLVEWLVGNLAVERLSCRALLVHAGVVARAGQALAFPAASGAGKSTLIAGLVAAGFEYLSDEILVLVPPGWAALPFPKSLAIRDGAYGVVAPLYPRLTTAPVGRLAAEAVRHLCPPATAWPAGPTPVRFVVFPQYRPGVPSALAPIPRSEALLRLLEHAVNAGVLGSAGVGGLVKLLRRANCYTLAVGDLRTAVHALLRLVETP